ncbi:hypothetical protein MUO83_02590 [Candidatus Bathyarchaeota archaeon]|jgi:hypothetical protein|nr:hypothetical protein [Candidatus Bathyarchaeota archaeon]
MLEQIRKQLEKDFGRELLDRLFESYRLVNEHYYLGKHRPCSSEGGRFAEVALRMLQQITTGRYIPLGESIPKFSNEVLKLENADSSKLPQSLRIQIPRTLQVIYDIRNKRDVGHVGGDVDSNFTDATLSLVCCNWVMTEFIRIYYTSDIATAQYLVNSLVKIRIPLIQDFNGFLKILKPELKLQEKVLAFLYYRGYEGATVKELNHWLSNRIQTGYMNLTLGKLEHEKAYVHREGDRYFITDTGRRFVEENIPFNV